MKFLTLICTMIAVLFSICVSADVKVNNKLAEKVYLSNEPLKIKKLTVKNATNESLIEFGKPFASHEEWLDKLNFQIENTTNKKIKYFNLEISFPGLKVDGSEVRHLLHYGLNIDEYGRRIENNETLEPKAKTTLTFPRGFSSAVRKLLAEKGINNDLGQIKVNIGMVIFQDNSAWKNGYFLIPDETKQGVWKVDNSKTNASAINSENSSKNLGIKPVSYNTSQGFGCGFYAGAFVINCGFCTYYGDLVIPAADVRGLSSQNFLMICFTINQTTLCSVPQAISCVSV